MTLLIVGIVVFLGIHTLPTNPGLREALVGRLGETGYKVLFSLLVDRGLRPARLRLRAARRSFRSGRRRLGLGGSQSS